MSAGHYWYAVCAKCGRTHMKRDMRSINVGNYNPKHLFWLCESCFLRLLDEMEVSM